MMSLAKPMPETVLVKKAYAKVNLFLNLLGQRANGFHNLVTVMQAIALADELTASVDSNQQPGIVLNTNQPDLTQSAEDNSVVKAYHLFFKNSPDLKPLSVTVNLSKYVPHQAGLGGGSADAAAMLQILNELTNGAYTGADLQQLAAQLGSDVPFFITGKTALATGGGELIQPLDNPLSSGLPMLIVKPKAISISTPDAYQWLREQNQYREEPVSSLLAALKDPHPEVALLNSLLFNDFETVVYRQCPELAKIVEQLRELNLPVCLSGSGSALFCFLTTQQWAIQAELSTDLNQLPIDYWFTRTV